MANGPVFTEGFLDRAHEYALSRTVVEGRGAVMTMTGPELEALVPLLQRAACAWVPQVTSGVVVEGVEPLQPQLSFGFAPGVSLLSLLAQSRSTRRHLQPQAVAVLVHDAALGFEALRRAALQGELRLQTPTLLAVRVGFAGNVVVFPVPDSFDDLRDIIGIYPVARITGVERGVDLGVSFSPEAARGLALPDSDVVFHLGSLLASCLRGRVVGGPTTSSMLDQLQRLVTGPSPELPPDVPAPLRELVLRTVCPADRRLPDLSQFCAALRNAFDLDDARVALSAHVHELFPQEFVAQRDFTLQGQHEAPTKPRIELVAPRHRVGAMSLEADVRLVTHGDFARYLTETGAPRPAHFVLTPEIARQPLIMISHADATVYARWRGGRLPTDAEWTALSNQRWVTDLGRVWEWTSDAGREGGWVVRGGPWRNQSGPGLPDHSSWEDGAAPDVGFRCVYDVP